MHHRRERARHRTGRLTLVLACEVCGGGEASSNVLYIPSAPSVVSAMLELHRDDEADPEHRYDSWPSALACEDCAVRIEALPPMPPHSSLSALAMTSRRWVLHLRRQLGTEPPARGPG